MSGTKAKQPGEKNTMSKNQFFAAAFSLAFVAGAARAESEASCLGEAAALPVASVAAGPAVPCASPASFATLTGAEFIVRGVEASAYCTRYTLERVSDGAPLRVEIAGRGVKHVPVAAGKLVVATMVSTGVVLSVAGRAIAFAPNALGRAVMHGA